MTAPVGRGGLKLEAALAKFALDRKLKGARAIDVGASTGGFTDVLLRHGAAHVTALDVGSGQLHPSLRKDARVTVLENCDFKKLSLDAAPGPFDFFTVDVSFVAARNMLRALAFRLRAGAEGVVLVKPQFELPDRVVKGRIDDPDVRREAVERVRQKGSTLGFTIEKFVDSPVPGGEGTVEILAHLKFHGRSEKLPQKGERRATQPQTQVRQIAAPENYFAIAAPGIEPILEREISVLQGVRAVRAVEGGVEFSGGIEVLMRANLRLRTATRVLVRLGEIDAREFAQLRRRAAKLPWERFLDKKTPVAVRAATTRCRLYHTGAIAENLESAIDDAVKTREADGEPQEILVRGVGDRFTISVDSSGALLHRRGWRTDGAEAPLRETLAAALILACDWDPSTPLCDPMCGAGTIAIEAAAIAMNVAPGIGRTFAFERWPTSSHSTFERLREEARAQQRAQLPSRILASDVLASAISAARANAERAQMPIEIAQLDLEKVRAPEGRGLVLTNPPYGKRVGDPRALRPLYARLGKLLRNQFRGWRAGVLLADLRLMDAIGFRPVEKRAFVNGGLRVTLVRS